MGDLNFEKGCVWYDLRFPALRPVPKAIQKSSGDPTYCRYFDYEPGNATRYEVAFCTYPTGNGLQTVMTIVNMHRSMVIPGRLEWSYQLGYMREKLELSDADCYALMPLINHYLEELGR